MAWNKPWRAKSTEYDFGNERRLTSGTGQLSEAVASFKSGTFAHGMELVPELVLPGAHEGNTLATVQNWDGTNFTMTLKNVNDGALGTVGFGWIAVSP